MDLSFNGRMKVCKVGAVIMFSLVTVMMLSVENS